MHHIARDRLNPIGQVSFLDKTLRDRRDCWEVDHRRTESRIGGGESHRDTTRTSPHIKQMATGGEIIMRREMLPRP